MKKYIPENYKTKLDLYDTQTAIDLIKRTFQDNLSKMLNLKRVSAPLFVQPQTGLNDDLNGVERAVDFDVPDADTHAQVVHSLAKWKRYALYRYGFYEGNGLYTDMNAIRRDETLDNIHSVYVDQWDWEKVITRDQRTISYLEETVRQIVKCIVFTSDLIRAKYPQMDLPQLDSNVTFITSEELLKMYPDKDASEREYLFAKAHGTIFIEKIGCKLSNGLVHDLRAPDYDDWSLNGDILFYNPLLDIAFEVSSMGIRVDKDSLKLQLEETGTTNRMQLMYHKLVDNETLPLTIGGGIGQSRLCMLILGKAHIGEVQSSVWDPETIKMCEEHGVILL